MTADRTCSVVVVDAANVVGSRPDGWWRDRRAANERLRDALADLVHTGIADLAPPVTVVLVVEGAARGVDSTPTVQVVSASGSGDDRIVELVAELEGRRCVVVTADRELRTRVEALGADVTGPRSVLPADRSRGNNRTS
ncbi:NTP pyrophosphohydrolase [Rhodococcus triatomae]|uniref:NTP pyrophosphohydrolase n=1 Tax=Rhodococcus triatomae TaxID=300028 RepID=UPI00157D0313|nr:NTP pyrophosphohydrolase [Rhodococcus triatomae]